MKLLPQLRITELDPNQDPIKNTLCEQGCFPSPVFQLLGGSLLLVVYFSWKKPVSLWWAKGTFKNQLLLCLAEGLKKATEGSSPLRPQRRWVHVNFFPKQHE